MIRFQFSDSPLFKFQNVISHFLCIFAHLENYLTTIYPSFAYLPTVCPFTHGLPICPRFAHLPTICPFDNHLLICCPDLLIFSFKSWLPFFFSIDFLRSTNYFLGLAIRFHPASYLRDRDAANTYSMYMLK